jgi:hypothetical protein
MSAIGSWTKFTKTISSGGTLTSEFDLGGAWGAVYLEIPSMPSGSAFYIQASKASGGTYRRIKHPAINSSTVTVNDFTLPSSATNCMVPIPNGLRYVKVETTATMDNGQEFTVLCGN